jgi:carbon-monoxide dehydrogenase large subunit
VLPILLIWVSDRRDGKLKNSSLRAASVSSTTEEKREVADNGVGNSLHRFEDRRFLHGRGQYVSDITSRGMWNAAFLRSPVAHARIKSIEVPAEARDWIFTASDLQSLRPIRSVSSLPGFQTADFPLLATCKVRYVGECVAVALAPTRAEAEDLLEGVIVDYEELEPAVEAVKARQPGSPLVHDEWSSNVVHRMTSNFGDIEAIAKAAKHVVTREFRTSRQAIMPMEGRAAHAYFDPRQNELVVCVSSQMPHLMSIGLAEILGLDQRHLRVISPDVGGGFGLKIFLEPETVIVAGLAMRVQRPIRWVEDNLEHLTADANCREHRYHLTAYTDNQGKILGLDAEIVVDGGAYSIWPWTSSCEAAQAAGILTGPYDIRNLRAEALTVATNKPPLCVYRGVARPGVCFAVELLIDAVARIVGQEPLAVRQHNMIKPEQMPYTTVTNKVYDSGDYPRALGEAADLIRLEEIRNRQKTEQSKNRLIGVGFASFTEQTAHGTAVAMKMGVELVPGLESARVRMTPDGHLVIDVAIHSHGQGLETTLAQIASEVLTIDPRLVTVRYGDTAISPYGTGTYASRSMVMAGGAVSCACKTLGERIKEIGAHLMQSDTTTVRIEKGAVVGDSARVEFATIARAWYLHPEELPPGVNRGGLTVEQGYCPTPNTGPFSYATHAAVVAVDIETGRVELLDYAVVEDCGRMVNPMIVEGQVIGGTAQGIGTALYEEIQYDSRGQSLSGSLAQYIIPGATEVPDIKLRHIVTPSPWTEFGIKGMGEGGAIAPPAAIANAVNDALRSFGIELCETPISPRRLTAAIANAERPRVTS